MEEEPIRSFKLVDDGPRYMLAADVARHYHQTPEQLFNLYPSLYRRQATANERANLKQWSISHAPLVTLVLAEEIECLLDKDDRRLHLQPKPGITQKTCTFKDQKLTLTKSSHAPPAPKQPTAPLKPGHPRSYFAPFFASPTGMASVSDEEEEHLASISLNLDLGGYKIKDQFLWNTQDKSINIHKFARQLCQDLEVPVMFSRQVAVAIQTQINAHHAIKDFRLDSDNIIIRIEVQVGTQQLVDQFEWEPSNPLNSPEFFAQSLARDLGLGPNYEVAIAVAIRDKLLQARQALLQSQPVSTATPISEAEQAFRTEDTDEWAPSIFTMTRSELQKKQTSQDRDSRRRRRGTRPEERPTKRSKRQVEQAREEEANHELQLLDHVPSYTPRVRAYLVDRGFGDITTKAWLKTALARQPMSKKALSNL